MYIKSTYDGLHVITGTTEGVSTSLFVFTCAGLCLNAPSLIDKNTDRGGSLMIIYITVSSVLKEKWSNS